MKKLKMLFIIAAFLGIGSSFAFKVKDAGDIYVRVGTGFQLKSTQSGECKQEQSSACNYVLKAGHQPLSESDFDYNITDNEMWDPAP